MIDVCSIKLQHMILKQFYNQKKEALKNKLSADFESNPKVHLYTDAVFDEAISVPVVMFKYDGVHWETSSEKTYKADVLFSIHIVMPKNEVNLEAYEDVFDLAQSIDSVILSGHVSDAFIDTHSTFKVHEKQWLNSQSSYWNKNDYFIWEIGYKTTLVENALKKKYNLIRNGVLESEITNLGYDLNTDFIENFPMKIKGKLEVNSKTSNITEISNDIPTESERNEDIGFIE